MEPYINMHVIVPVRRDCDGALIGAPAPAGSHKEQRTYFSTITIVANKPRRSYIEVTPQKVILDDRERMILPSSSSITVETANLAVVIIANTNLTVTIQELSSLSSYSTITKTQRPISGITWVLYR